jgi:hypothetical protein
MRVCVFLCISPIVASQQLRKNPLIVARYNRYRVKKYTATIEDLLDPSFSMLPVLYQGK